MSDDIKNRERWAERFLSGEKMVPVDLVKKEYSSQIDLRKVANYAAAMEIGRKDAERVDMKPRAMLPATTAYRGR